MLLPLCFTTVAAGHDPDASHATTPLVITARSLLARCSLHSALALARTRALAPGKLLPVFNEQPEPGSTESITRDLHTGLTAVDSLTPVGRGQSMLVIGPKPSIKRSLAVDTIHAQATGETDVKCVYACLSGQVSQGLGQG